MRRFLLILALLATCAGCHRREILPDETVRLVLRVHDSLPILGRVASGHHYETHLFRADNGVLAETSYTEAGGGIIYAAAGPYNLVSFNFDTESLQFEGEGSFSQLCAMSSRAPSSAEALFREVVERASVKSVGPADRETVVGEPGYLFAARLEHLHLPLRYPGDKELVLTADAWPMVKVCRLVVEGVTGQENLSSATGFLTGMIRGRYLGTGEPADSAVLRFAFRKNPSASTLEGCFTTFGCAEGEDHWLYLLLTDAQGGRYLFSFDITRLCEPSAEVLDIPISLHFDIPEPEHGGGGFAPATDDWQVIEHPIYL